MYLAIDYILLEQELPSPSIHFHLHSILFHSILFYSADNSILADTRQVRSAKFPRLAPTRPSSRLARHHTSEVGNKEVCTTSDSLTSATTRYST